MAGKFPAIPSSWGETLELAKQGLAPGDIALAGRVFDVEFFHHAIVDKHRIALGAGAKAVARSVESHVDRLGKVAVAVSKKIDLSFRACRFLPGFHDENVVHA